MTRINVVPVEKLCRQHLIAEHRGLPRVFALTYKASQSTKPWTDKQPKNYILGTGHVTFFYDKLGYLAERHRELTQEMLSRGYNPTFTGCLWQEWSNEIPVCYWKDYVPTEEAIAINLERINERLSKMS
jgi:deoxyribonuclease (pyrimidine dimer)